MSDVADAGQIPSPVTVPGVTIKGPMRQGYDRVLSAEALAFIAELERRFGAERRKLLELRDERQGRLDRGEFPDFLPETEDVRPGRSVAQRRRSDLS